MRTLAGTCPPVPPVAGSTHCRPVAFARRGAVALTLATGLASLALAPPPVSAATSITPAPAPASLADLRAEVDRVTAELLEGTRRLEQGQAQLAHVQARKAVVRAQADQAVALAQAARARLGQMVSAQYRSPMPTTAQLALAGPPEQLVDAVHAMATLDSVRGSQQDALAEADRQRLAAEELVAEANTLEADTARQEQDLAQQVAGLQRRAQDANDKFNAAAAAVAAAEAAARAAARAAAEAAARAAAEAAARAAAEEAAAAEAAQQERERAAQGASRGRSTPAKPAAVAPLAPRSAGGSCGGGNLAGYPNGMLPTSALCPLDGTNGLVLRADAAAAFNRMAAAGGMPCAGNSYRSYSQQVALYAQKPSLAAVPGTSNHGWGVAVDFACGAERFGTPAYQWLQANGPAYGWTHPSWAEPDGSRPEPWHWEYTG